MYLHYTRTRYLHTTYYSLTAIACIQQQNIGKFQQRYLSPETPGTYLLYILKSTIFALPIDDPERREERKQRRRKKYGRKSFVVYVPICVLCTYVYYTFLHRKSLLLGAREEWRNWIKALSEMIIKLSLRNKRFCN